MNFLKKQRMTSYLLSILSIIIGVFLLFFPHETKIIVCYMLGGSLAVVGFFKILTFLLNKAEYRKNDDLISSIILLTLGFILLIKSDLLIKIYPIIIGGILIIKSAFAFSDALDYKKTGFKDWWIDVLFLIVTSIFGFVLIVLDEKVASNFLVYFAGIALILDGVFSMFFTMVMSSKTHHQKLDDNVFFNEVIFNQKKEEEMKK